MSARQWFYWFAPRGRVYHLATTGRWQETITLDNERPDPDWGVVPERPGRSTPICKRCDRARERLEAES